MRIAHCGDVHIRNLKYHKEYRAVFSKMYDILREQKVDAIVCTGDVCHTKCQISPEYVELASNFLDNLSDIAPTYIILGNHDGNLKNNTRQDSITPIVNALDKPNLHLLKNSGERILNDKFAINVLSIFDEDNWEEPSDFNRVNVALYHGAIGGCETDIGWKMEHCDNDISIFRNFDFAMLGDIHKTNQPLDKAGRIRYCGSTVQQNFGETNDKGFLIWDIQDKDTFTVKHHAIPNPKPFVSILLTKNGEVPEKANPPKGARIRIITDNNLPLDVIRKAHDIVKKRFKPETIAFLNRNATRSTIDDVANSFKKEDLRDITTQERLIAEYLKGYNISDDLKSKICEINRKYDLEARANEEVGRNINFEVLDVEWDNLFNYGESNKIKLKDCKGIVGIFGKNFSGKSSIIDSLLYTIYNSISKNSRKNLNIINDAKDNCRGKARIRVGHRVYTIERTSEKYIKKLKGQETIEAKTDVDFSFYDEVTRKTESLNGLTRSDTDKNIIKLFGTVDDFLLTSMSSQLGALDFINEGSTKRKEILAKFLDLEIFDKKYKLAKDDVSELKGAVKRFENRDFDAEHKEASQELAQQNQQSEAKKTECEEIQERNRTVRDLIFDLQKKIDAAPEKLINIDKVEDGLKEKNNKLSEKKLELVSLQTQIDEGKKKKDKVSSFLKQFDIEALKEKKTILAEHRTDLNLLSADINEQERELEYGLEKVQLLAEVPCGSEFSHCKFIRGAYEAKEQINLVQLVLDKKKEEYKTIDEKVISLDPKKVNEHLEKYNFILNQEKEISNEIEHNNALIDSTQSSIELLTKEIALLEKDCERYYENKKLIDELEKVTEQRGLFDAEKENNLQRLKTCEGELHELLKSHGYLEQKIEKVKTEQEEFEKASSAYEAYDLYLKCMHPNGIAYDIIKKSLPAINEEIAEILLNIVDFQVFFVNDEKRLDLYIKRPKDPEPRPLEMGSGAEKTVSAIAIRLAFLYVSTLPRGNMFILDEPGTALDEENMIGFIKMLEIIKEYFRCILLISHLDGLKDTADSIINIEHKDGFAFVDC